MILDTSFLVDVLRGDDALEAAVTEVDASGPAKVTAITVIDLWEGIHRSSASERERRAVEDLLRRLHEVPFGRECAMVAGEVCASLADRGVAVETADVQIAASALVHEEPVLTRNPDHFERVDGLDVVAY